MSHQWLPKKKLNTRTYVVVGTVDYEDKVKRKFYVDKMMGILKKHGYMAKSRVASKNVVEILAKEKPLNKYDGVAWVHPLGGGDDFRVKVTVKAENLTEAKAMVRKHLIEKNHTHKAMADDFSIKRVKK